jgi:ABC-type nitrate/sulfonate/bicarbonate transport system substrate-binding protein
MRRPRLSRVLLNARVIAVAALAASGCGDDAPSGERSQGEPTKLTVGLVPIADVAPVYLGIENGFFEDEGLEVEIQIAQGGAEIVPQVMSGDVQIGFSNTPTLFSAAVEGVPIQIAAPAGGSPPKKEGRGENVEGALMVKNDSPIRDYADLAGKTVAVNTLGNVIDVTVNAALERHGVDHSTVERLEVPFPDMLAALDAGRVDAAFLATPFKTIAEQSGDYRAVGFPIYEARPELIYIGYFVSRRWAENNEDVLERFLSALRRSMLYAAEHEQETRETLGKFTELPKDLLPALPPLNRRPDCEELEVSSKLLAGLMVKYGALDRQPDLDELIRPGFCDG